MVENAEFAATLDTSDEWIRARTGIERRHFAAEGEQTSDLAIAAARAALADAGLTGADIDAIILATATPDQTFPSTATRVQTAIGMRGGFAFDIQAVCAGFVFALAQADALIRARRRAAGDGDRRRDLLAHPRLHRPRHLRAVRRRRRRADPRGGRGHRHHRRTAASWRPTCIPTGATPTCSTWTAGRRSTGTAGVVRMAGQEVFKHAVIKLAATGAAALDARRADDRRRGLAGAAPGEPAHHDA